MIKEVLLLSLFIFQGFAIRCCDCDVVDDIDCADDNVPEKYFKTYPNGKNHCIRAESTEDVKADPEVVVIKEYLTKREIYTQVFNNVVLIASHGTIDLKLKEPDMKELIRLRKISYDCRIQGENCLEFLGSAIWHTVYTFSDENIVLTEEDLVIRECLMNGGCAQVINHFYLKGSNGTIDLHLKDVVIRECFMNGEGCAQLINDFYLKASKGFNLHLKESDIKEVIRLYKISYDCVVQGENCQKFIGTAIWYTVYILSDKAIILTEPDLERANLAISCAMGSQDPECGKVYEQLMSLVMDNLFHKYPECFMYGKGCVEIINDAVLMASHGTIDLHLKESDIKELIRLHKISYDCVVQGENCQKFIGTAIWYIVYTLSNEAIILTEEDLERANFAISCAMGSQDPECGKVYKQLMSLVMDNLFHEYPGYVMIRDCVINGEGCVQVINHAVLMASNGTINLQLKEFDLEKIVKLNTLVMDCVVEGEKCDQLVGTAISYTVNTLSNETIILTEEDFERGLLIANCLMGSIMTECDSKMLMSLRKNITDMLAQRYPEVSMIRECLMNGEGCAQVVDEVVLMASSGTIDLQLKELDFEMMKEFDTLVMDCVMKGKRCDQLTGFVFWYTVYIVSNQRIPLTEEEVAAVYKCATERVGCGEVLVGALNLATNGSFTNEINGAAVIYFTDCVVGGDEQSCKEICRLIIFDPSGVMPELNEEGESNQDKDLSQPSCITDESQTADVESHESIDSTDVNESVEDSSSTEPAETEEQEDMQETIVKSDNFDEVEAEPECQGESSVEHAGVVEESREGEEPAVESVPDSEGEPAV